MYAFFAFVAGLVFGIGLLVSGMINPVKVLGFLDLAGRWDPSLALVMVGAIAIGIIGFVMAGRRPTTVLGGPMLLPTTRTIDRRLVVGGAVFGVGWGLAGFCPGPALAALGTGHLKAIVFVAAMVTGMLVFEWIEGMRAHSTARLESAAGTASE